MVIYDYSNIHRIRYSCVDAKRIYSDAVFEWVCPECQEENHTNFDGCPLISCGYYCHDFCCEHCEREFEDKMYTLNNIKENSVDITPSPLYDLKVYKVKYVLEEITE